MRCVMARGRVEWEQHVGAFWSGLAAGEDWGCALDYCLRVERVVSPR